MGLRYGRFGAVSGMVFILALYVGDTMATAGQGPMDTAEAISAGIRRDWTAQNIAGIALLMLGFAAFTLFLGYLRERLRSGGDWLGQAAALAGGLTIAIKLGTVAPTVAPRLGGAAIGPQATLGLYDIGEIGFIVTGFTFSVFVLAAALSGLSARGTMPRWLAWAGLVIGVAGLVTPVAGLTDPVNYMPVPWLLQSLWVLLLAGAWSIRPRVATATTRTRAGLGWRGGPRPSDMDGVPADRASGPSAGGVAAHGGRCARPWRVRSCGTRPVTAARPTSVDSVDQGGGVRGPKRGGAASGGSGPAGGGSRLPGHPRTWITRRHPVPTVIPFRPY